MVSEARVTSDPEGASIFLGKDKDSLRYVGKTPTRQEVIDVAALCYQVKMEGYIDSEVRCYDYNVGGRHVHFDLEKW